MSWQLISWLLTLSKEEFQSCRKLKKSQPASVRMNMCDGAGLLLSTCSQRVQSEGQFSPSSPTEGERLTLSWIGRSAASTNRKFPENVVGFLRNFEVHWLLHQDRTPHWKEMRMFFNAADSSAGTLQGPPSSQQICSSSSYCFQEIVRPYIVMSNRFEFCCMIV